MAEELSCTVLYCTVLYCSVLHCTCLQVSELHGRGALGDGFRGLLQRPRRLLLPVSRDHLGEAEDRDAWKGWVCECFLLVFVYACLVSSWSWLGLTGPGTVLYCTGPFQCLSLICRQANRQTNRLTDIMTYWCAFDFARKNILHQKERKRVGSVD